MHAESDGAKSAPATEQPGDGRAPLSLRIINLAAVLIPFAGLIAAVTLLWGVAFSWVHLGLLLGMYLVTALGITIGYHRLFTHRSFKAPAPVAAVLAVMGSMAVQGPIFQWVATHRKHHQHSDHHDDPHSPHVHGASGIVGTVRGMWHAHMGWLWNSSVFDSSRSSIESPSEGMSRYIKDLEKVRLYRWLSLTFPVWVVLGLVLPAVLGGLITMSWTGAALGFVWGGLVRIFFVHHVTWSINSVCHLWGTRPYNSHDESRNNAIFGVLALGEGWHNNHHAFPASARHGLRWWQLDVSYIIIWGMSKIGLASDIKIPSPERMIAKRSVR